MKDGRTHLAHKAEHAVDMETGAIVAVTLQGADVGDTTTIIETAIAATEQVEDAQANVDDRQSLEEIVGDKGYHSNQTLIDLDAVGIRSYVSEPDRGRRDWSKDPEARAPVSGNRRRMRGRRGRRLMRQRGERIERSFAHLYDTGGMRRTPLRGHTNILKSLLIHAGGFNLGLVTFGPQGPTLGDLSDAYLQDYQVRQFRSVSTARGRVVHLTAFFGRAARAAALTTYHIRQYQLARRAAGAATGTINRETSALHRMGTLAVHWGWLDTVPGFPDRLRENPPRQGFFEHPEYLAVRAHLPAPWQDILDVAYYSGWRKQEILGLTWDEIDRAGGVIRLSPARSKTLVGRILPISPPIAEALARRRARRDPVSPLVFHRLQRNPCKSLFINR